MSNYVNSLPGVPVGLSNGEDSEYGYFEETGQDIIDTGTEIGLDYAEKWARKQMGLDPPPTTTPQVAQPVVVQPPARQVATPTQPIQETTPEVQSEGVMNTVISKVKQVPPILAAAVTGLATKYFSKSWLGALGVGGATWFLTDKWQKS